MTLPEGLTLNKLIALAKTPEAGHKPAVLEFIQGSILSQYGDMPVKGGVVAISNGPLKGSEEKSFKEQSALVASHGCQMPRIVDAVALLFLTGINSSTIEKDPVLLLSNAYTRCIESDGIGNQYMASFYVIVGGFKPPGLWVNSNHSSVNMHHICVVAVRRL